MGQTGPDSHQRHPAKGWESQNTAKTNSGGFKEKIFAARVAQGSCTCSRP